MLDDLDRNNRTKEIVQDISLIANNLLTDENLGVQDIGLKMLKIRDIDKLNLNYNQKETYIIDSLIGIRLEMNEIVSSDSELAYLMDTSKEIDSIIQEIDN